MSKNKSVNTSTFHLQKYLFFKFATCFKLRTHHQSKIMQYIKGREMRICLRERYNLFMQIIAENVCNKDISFLKTNVHLLSFRILVIFDR
jgi:hypothetical protein